MSKTAEKALFCTSQRLTLLRPRTATRQYLSGERFWHERHAKRLGAEEPPSPWRALKRSVLVHHLTAKGKIKRLALVCAAGLGKSTNLQWLAKELAAPATRQVPFHFALDDKRLPDTLREFWRRTLPDRIRQAPGNSHLPDAQLVAALQRLQAQGRITLLLDSIDQASTQGLQLLRELLATRDWERCPIVVTARPHALFDQWDDVIGADEQAWRFLRVEPLAPRQRQLLLNQDGVNRYRRLPPGGRALMANPRNIEYVRKCDPAAGTVHRTEPDSLEEYTLRDLRTASHVFAGAVHHMVRYGMRNPAARKLGRRKDRPPPAEVTQRQLDFALDLLGALAFTMYTLPTPGSARATPFRPNVSQVAAAQMPKFTAAVLKRIRKAGIVERDYRIDDLEDDLDALAELNAEIQFDLLDTRPHRRGEFRWYDRSLQEFFAAWWLSRYADKKQGDLGRLREWRYDDPRDDTARTLYQPLWGFLTEMPKAVRRERIWASAVGLLYERGAPRCCEMIYRSWRPMWRCRAGRPYLRDWQQEFKTILATPGPEGEVAQALCRNSRRSGFRRCPKDPADDYTPFLMGSPETEKERFQDELLHTVVVTPFLMHEFPVTNAQYELFDPAHQQERLGNLPESEARDHPVVNVTWFQAWCFARWTGNHLPTEAEWEYACRGGAPSNQPFHFGDSLSSKQANFDGKYPYGGADKGQYLERTTKVGSYQRNAFELYDMHGNVWEWCADWYGARYYEKSRQKDPRGPRVASARVLRGGGWLDSGRSCRSALRYRNEPDDRYRNDGFRLAAVPCAVGAQQGEPGQA